MPPTLSKPSGAAPASLLYITIGALMTVWSAIWYSYLHKSNSDNGASGYLCLGFLITGIVLLAIGFFLGPIARWSRHAEMPPSEVTPTGVQETPQNAPRRN